MPYTLRARLGMWLQRFAITHRWLLAFDGIAPHGRRRYINRINRHVVVLDPTSTEGNTR